MNWCRGRSLRTLEFLDAVDGVDYGFGLTVFSPEPPARLKQPSLFAIAGAGFGGQAICQRKTCDINAFSEFPSGLLLRFRQGWLNSLALMAIPAAWHLRHGVWCNWQHDGF